jgi:RNA polymerase sigma factor (sigma-70 family)
MSSGTPVRGLQPRPPRSQRESAGGVTDEQLLERFVSNKDAAAFEELVRRHGPMVLRVCQRVLQQAQDAEDAFQVTFLILARKAAAIAKRGSVGSWLYGVAYRVALQTRDASQRHPAPVGGQDAAITARPQQPGEAASDARQALDEELNRLPEKYRAPLVLCYLEGKTNDEAADQLGCSRGTIATRLSRGRDRLRDGLVRRGVTVSGAVLVALLGQSAAKAAVPAGLATTTAKAATAVAAGKAVAGGLVTAQAGALFHAALRAMFWAKIKMAALVVTAAAVVTVPAYIVLKPDTSGLVGHYALAEGKGTQIRDDAANGNHGKLVGGVTWVAGPKPGTMALDFDGRTGHVQLDRDASPWLGGTGTVAYWIKTTQTGGDTDSSSPGIVGTAVLKNEDVVWGWLDAQGRLGVVAGAGPGAGTQPSAQSKQPINDGRWHHVAMTRNATTGEVAMYVDGVFQNKTLAGIGLKPAPLTALARFDSVQGQSVYYFRGALSDLRMYGRLLSADEIRRLAQ